MNNLPGIYLPHNEFTGLKFSVASKTCLLVSFEKILVLSFGFFGEISTFMSYLMPKLSL